MRCDSFRTPETFPSHISLKRSSKKIYRCPLTFTQPLTTGVAFRWQHRTANILHENVWQDFGPDATRSINAALRKNHEVSIGAWTVNLLEMVQYRNDSFLMRRQVRCVDSDGKVVRSTAALNVIDVLFM